MSAPTPAPPAQPRNPLHGLTLEAIVKALHEAYGWDGLHARIPLRCFAFDPSVKSSLQFLRRTPWAREKVEGLYLACCASAGVKAAPERPDGPGLNWEGRRGHPGARPQSDPARDLAAGSLSGTSIVTSPCACSGWMATTGEAA